MILVTRLDRQIMFLNPDHIITIEETPDTVITLFNGHHFIVKERATVIINRIVSFRSSIIRRAEKPRGGFNYLVRARRQKFKKKCLQSPKPSESDPAPLHRQDR